MDHLSPITQDEMVAVFLKTELHSRRYRERILAVLQQLGIDPPIVGEPDIGNAFDNATRLRIFGEFRGYGRN